MGRGQLFLRSYGQNTREIHSFFLLVTLAQGAASLCWGATGPAQAHLKFWVTLLLLQMYLGGPEAPRLVQLCQRRGLSGSRAAHALGIALLGKGFPQQMGL